MVSSVWSSERTEDTSVEVEVGKLSSREIVSTVGVFTVALAA